MHPRDLSSRRDAAGAAVVRDEPPPLRARPEGMDDACRLGAMVVGTTSRMPGVNRVISPAYRTRGCRDHRETDGNATTAPGPATGAFAAPARMHEIFESPAPDPVGTEEAPIDGLPNESSALHR